MVVSFLTLGCKSNQFDTQAMESILASRGHTIRSFNEECDAYVINTCSVTSVGDKKSRQLIRQTRRRAPNSIIGVCGCFSQLHPDSDVLNVADVVSGSTDREGFLQLLEKAYADRCQRHNIVSPSREFEYLPAGGLEGRTRAMLKIQDGCNNYCTYCIIPYSRGHIRSMSPEYAVKEIKRLRYIGYLEVVITGIEISSYGLEMKPRVSLISLLESLSKAAPDIRLRLGSLEPRTITEDFCLRASKLSNICP
ncbi:MAG: radical SAM protein, partial [Clostridiales bacterium]|nr:radical SAM protein [Clostridiales bacterium]